MFAPAFDDQSKSQKNISNQKCYQSHPQKWHQQKEDVNISIHKRKIQTKMACYWSFHPHRMSGIARHLIGEINVGRFCMFTASENIKMSLN
jgi:hypothetical protein